MIYGLSNSKGKGLGYYHKPYNSRTNMLVKPSNPSSSSTTTKELYAHLIPATEKGKILNQLESMACDSLSLKEP